MKIGICLKGIQDIQKDRNGCYGYGRVLKNKKRNIANDPQSKLGN